MKLGLFGLPTVGKTTLFNLLTGAQIETPRYGGGRSDPNLGIARVPDPRLWKLSRMFNPRKTVPSTVEYVDIVGLQKGDAAGSLSLAVLQPMDALAHVVRAFADEEIPHSEGSIDPARDIETMEMELILADLDKTTKRIERLKTSIPKTNKPEEKKELELLERIRELLEAGQPLRGVDLTPDQEKAMRGFAFYSAKPLLIMINLGEDDAAVSDVAQKLGLQAVADRPSVAIAGVSAKIEAEIAALSEEEAAEFRKEMGITEPALDRIIRSSFELLGLISFYTVGEDECRAWPIQRGTSAQQGAGTIHSDLEKGFIRAEVVSYEDLVACGSMSGARDKGLLRLEGKEYVVADGDIMHIRSGI